MATELTGASATAQAVAVAEPPQAPPEPRRADAAPRKQEAPAPGRDRPPEAPTPEDIQAKLRQQFELMQSQGLMRQVRMEYVVSNRGLEMVKVRDEKTDKVIRTIPQEELVEFARRMQVLQGVLFDSVA